MRFGGKKWERRGERGEGEKRGREEGVGQHSRNLLEGLVGNLFRCRPIFLRQKSFEG
jgi:hypothetical protein